MSTHPLVKVAVVVGAAAAIWHFLPVTYKNMVIKQDTGTVSEHRATTVKQTPNTTTDTQGKRDDNKHTGQQKTTETTHTTTTSRS